MEGEIRRLSTLLEGAALTKDVTGSLLADATEAVELGRATDQHQRWVIARLKEEVLALEAELRDRGQAYSHLQREAGQLDAELKQVGRQLKEARAHANDRTPNPTGTSSTTQGIVQARENDEPHPPNPGAWKPGVSLSSLTRGRARANSTASSTASASNATHHHNNIKKKKTKPGTVSGSTTSSSSLQDVPYTVAMERTRATQELRDARAREDEWRQKAESLLAEKDADRARHETELARLRAEVAAARVVGETEKQDAPPHASPPVDENEEGRGKETASETTPTSETTPNPHGKRGLHLMRGIGALLSPGSRNRKNHQVHTAPGLDAAAAEAAQRESRSLRAERDRLERDYLKQIRLVTAERDLARQRLAEALREPERDGSPGKSVSPPTTGDEPIDASSRVPSSILEMELKNLEIELRSEKQAREAAQHQIELAKEEAAARTREARERAEREVKAAQDEAKALRTILEETERDREEARAALQGRAKKTLLVEKSNDQTERKKEIEEQQTDTISNQMKPNEVVDQANTKTVVNQYQEGRVAVEGGVSTIGAGPGSSSRSTTSAFGVESQYAKSDRLTEELRVAQEGLRRAKEETLVAKATIRKAREKERIAREEAKGAMETKDAKLNKRDKELHKAQEEVVRWRTRAQALDKELSKEAEGKADETEGEGMRYETREVKVDRAATRRWLEAKARVQRILASNTTTMDLSESESGSGSVSGRDGGPVGPKAPLPVLGPAAMRAEWKKSEAGRLHAERERSILEDEVVRLAAVAGERDVLAAQVAELRENATNTNTGQAAAWAEERARWEAQTNQLRRDLASVVSGMRAARGEHERDVVEPCEDLTGPDQQGDREDRRDDELARAEQRARMLETQLSTLQMAHDALVRSFQLHEVSVEKAGFASPIEDSNPVEMREGGAEREPPSASMSTSSLQPSTPGRKRRAKVAVSLNRSSLTSPPMSVAFAQALSPIQRPPEARHHRERDGPRESVGGERDPREVGLVQDVSGGHPTWDESRNGGSNRVRLVSRRGFWAMGGAAVMYAVVNALGREKGKGRDRDGYQERDMRGGRKQMR